MLLSEGSLALEVENIFGKLLAPTIRLSMIVFKLTMGI